MLFHFIIQDAKLLGANFGFSPFVYVSFLWPYARSCPMFMQTKWICPMTAYNLEVRLKSLIQAHCRFSRIGKCTLSQTTKFIRDYILDFLHVGIVSQGIKSEPRPSM